MLFNSYVFIFLFLPIALIGFFALARWTTPLLAKLWLTVASFVFYGYWNVAYVPLLLVSVSFNYLIGGAIAREPRESLAAKWLLGAGVSLNLAIIAYYKYANFLIDSLNGVLRAQFELPIILLPLAISFYTFTQIAYLVDAYRGETQGENYNFVNYCLFVVFFPQLIAGPILRHDELIPQLREGEIFSFSQRNFAIGMVLFSLGLSKKVLIADNVSPWVAPVFQNAADASFIETWVGALSYTFQLYFDFSGYSDMAIGLGLMFNTHLPINFNSPYKAISITDFWRRWHITLSNFLRDYLYIPLGGNRHGQVRRYGNLMTTMLLGGLWHGAGWTFVLWGGFHGLYLCINHAWRKFGVRLPQIVGWAVTFVAVVAGWVLFRAQNLAEGVALLRSLLGFNGIVIPGEAGGKLSVLTQFGIGLKSWNDLAYIPEIAGTKTIVFGILLVLLAVVTLAPNTQEIVKKMKPNALWATGLGLMAGISLLSLNRVSEFLYFQF